MGENTKCNNCRWLQEINQCYHFGKPNVDGCLKFIPKPERKKCPKCGSQNTTSKEVHEDCTGGMDEIVLKCLDCGFEDS